MSLLQSTCALVACFTLFASTGCVGPMACGPCGSCGPVGLNACGGCEDCSGCGELYIDPWINEPANCTDPCDQCGNYNGQSCGKCRSIFDGFPSLWGYRCDSGCDSCGVADCRGGCGPSAGCDAGCGGCDSCGGALEVACGLEPDCGCDGGCDGGCDACSGGLVEVGCGIEASCGCDGGCASCGGGGSVFALDAGDTGYHQSIVVNPTPAKDPYRPSRTKQIFRPKSNVAGKSKNLR